MYISSMVTTSGDVEHTSSPFGTATTWSSIPCVSRIEIESIEMTIVFPTISASTCTVDSHNLFDRDTPLTMMRCGASLSTTKATTAISIVLRRLPSSRVYGAVGGGGKRYSSSLRKRSSRAAEFSSSNTQPHRRIVVAHPSSSSSPPRGGFFAWYSAKLDTHPLTTKCISAGLISSIANILAQGIAFQQDKRSRSRSTSDGSSSSSSEDVSIQKRHSTPPTTSTTTSPNASIFEFWSEFQIDPQQVGRFAFLNFVFVAPVFHTWYAFLNKMIPGVTWRQVIHRTFWGE